jgi:aldehyde:ferredoxin oxidoreductase
MGGFFAPELRFAGFDHLVLTGRAEKPTYLFVHDGEIVFRDAEHFRGLDCWDAQQAIKDDLGDQEAQVLAIGPAGENLVRFANVRTGHKSAGGRTGMGAVLGAKNVKAVAARGTMDIQLADPQGALEYDRLAIDKIVKTKFGQIMQKWGTMFIYGVTNSTGLVRVNNFLGNQFRDSEAIECENIEEHSVGSQGCFGCQLHCRHRYVIRDGPYAGTYGEGPEYTTQGAFGAEIGGRDFATVLYGNHLCNRLGMDTLETGSLVAWAMECYEQGLLDKQDTGGLDLRFGNTEAAVELTRRIAARRGLGDVLAEGPRGAMKKLGRRAAKLCIQVKGMSNLHSDERPTPSLALGIATATRGSDHLRSRPAVDLYHLPEPALRAIYSDPIPYDGPLTSDYRDYAGKPWQVRWHETLYATIDCLGVCKFHTVFLGVNLVAWDEFAKWLELIPGLKLSKRQLWDVGLRVTNLERMFNLREGFTKRDDWLVDRYFDEPTPAGLDVVRGRALSRPKLKKAIAEYYALHGWDGNGVPTPETLRRLGLAAEPAAHDAKGRAKRAKAGPLAAEELERFGL